MTKKALVSLAVFLPAALLTGCLGRVLSPSAQPLAESASEACLRLQHVSVGAAAIGLPTSGAVVTGTKLVAATGAGNAAVGEYCQVTGSIAPRDPAAPPILFQLNLPTAWNRKTLHFGGGGYDGTVISGMGDTPARPTTRMTPLALGYATFGSDSGHKSGAAFARQSSLDGSFGSNAEALANFAGDALKKVHDVALALIQSRYHSLPAHMYFAGGSSGGREALAVAQRWPDDYDGVIAAYPAWNAASLDLAFGRLARVFAAPGAYLNPKKQGVLYNAEIAACDTLDGLADGIISHPSACHFNPATLRCPGGKDTGDDCLSDAQISALNIYAAPIRFAYPVDSGETGYPGFNVLRGADTRGVLGLNAVAPANPPALFDMPYWASFWDQWVKYFVTSDSHFNALTLDPQHPGIFQQRIAQLTALQDVNSPDLSAFARRGGKLLLMHGAADALVATDATIDYYQRVQAVMGKDKTQTFLRFYIIPGYGHVFGTFMASWDSLTTLDDWVTQGRAPVHQIVADSNAATRGRTRPLCEYPQWPRYKGSGDANLASSFECIETAADIFEK